MRIKSAANAFEKEANRGDLKAQKEGNFTGKGQYEHRKAEPRKEGGKGQRVYK